MVRNIIYLLLFVLGISSTVLAESRFEMHGDIQKAYGEDGRLLYEMTIQDNQIAGWAKFYAPDGDVAQGNLKDGKRHGKFTTRSKDETLIQTQYFYEGNLHGSDILYYPNGNMIYEKKYDQGVLHGVSHFYYKNGQLSETIPYERGVISGVFKGYYYDGIKREEGLYANDQLNGLYKAFFADGNLQLEAIVSKSSSNWPDNVL